MTPRILLTALLLCATPCVAQPLPEALPQHLKASLPPPQLAVTSSILADWFKRLLFRVGR